MLSRGSRVGLFVLALLLIAVPLAAGAQPAGKVYRIGIFGDKAAEASEKHLWQVFRDGLREHGWTEGANLVIDYRWAEGDAARLQELAAKLVRLKPDVIATRGSLFTAALKAATSSIPDRVRRPRRIPSGPATSRASPGPAETSRVAALQTELGPKGLELLHAVVPSATRIAVLWHQGTPSAIPGLKALEDPARTLGLKLQPVGARPRAGERLRDHGQGRRAGRPGLQHAAVQQRATADRRAGRRASSAYDVPGTNLHRRGRPDQLLPATRGQLAALRRVRGQDPRGARPISPSSNQPSSC